MQEHAHLVLWLEHLDRDSAQPRPYSLTPLVIRKASRWRGEGASRRHRHRGSPRTPCRTRPPPSPYGSTARHEAMRPRRGGGLAASRGWQRRAVGWCGAHLRSLSLANSTGSPRGVRREPGGSSSKSSCAASCFAAAVLTAVALEPGRPLPPPSTPTPAGSSTIPTAQRRPQSGAGNGEACDGHCDGKHERRNPGRKNQ